MARSMSSEDNFAYLLISLILLLLGLAASEQFFHGGQIIVIAVTVFCLAVSVFGIKREHLWYRNGLGALLVITLISVFGSMLEILHLELVTLTAIATFLALSVWVAAKQVLFSGHITWNQIIGSVCIFLLFGLLWAFLYLINIELFGVAFNGLEEAHWTDNLSQVIYYSFVTLSTVGYGEITPALPLVRALAYLEAIIGQFYMAILVASLVGARMSNR